MSHLRFILIFLVVTIVVVVSILFYPNSESHPLDSSTAMQLARGFLRYQAECGGRGVWRDVSVTTTTPFFDQVGIITAYEVAVQSPSGTPAGWLMVEAWGEHPPVVEYTTVGLSNADQLRAAASAHKVDADVVQLLWAGPGTHAWSASGRTPVHIDGSPAHIATAAIYREAGRRALRGFSIDTLRLGMTRAKQISVLREGFLHQDFHHVLFGECEGAEPS